MKIKDLIKELKGYHPDCEVALVTKRRYGKVEGTKEITKIGLEPESMLTPSPFILIE